MNILLRDKPQDDEVLAWLLNEDQPPEDGLVRELYSSGEFSGKPNEFALLYNHPRAKRLAIGGIGKKSDAYTVRNAVGAMVRNLKARQLRKVAVELSDSLRGHAAAAVEGAVLGDYEPDQHKTDPKKADRKIESFVLLGASQADVDRGRMIGEAANFGRDLVNEPANVVTPTILAERAEAMAKEFGLECEILDRDRMRQLGMGSLLGVAQGSDEPPAMIILRYVPENSSSSDHLGLIGKGVTFDTGGVSIKPADGMEKMKYDMGGGAAVIGAMRAIAQLKPKVRVTGVVPTVENMLSGSAQRPGDIVKSLNGKTIEVLNTDAEGRLILVDAITYAIRLGCTHLVDAATLTGAIVVALGHVHIGAFTNNDDLLRRVLEAGKVTGDRMWHMPLDEDYKEYLKSAFADLPNIGGRWGGAITAAYFLKEFTEDKPWVHLDIAGTAWLDESKPHMAKGPTGVPLRAFVQLAMDWAS